MSEDNKDSDALVIFHKICYHCPCEKRQEDDNHSCEHKRTPSEAIDQESSQNCANNLEDSQQHYTHIRISLIPIFNDQEELFCILKDGIDARQLVCSCKHEPNDNKTDLIAFATSRPLLKVFLFVDISRGFVTWLNFDRNDFVLSYLALKSLPIWAVDHFQVASDLEILALQEMALECVVGKKEEQSYVNEEADNRDTDEESKCCLF